LIVQLEEYFSSALLKRNS